MADQQLSTAAKKSKKKGGGIAKHFRNLIKSATGNDSASQSDSTRVSAFGAHNSIPGNVVESTESTASNGNATVNQGPTALFQSARLPSSSVQDLQGSAVIQEDDYETNLTSTIVQSNSQTQVPDWKAVTKGRLEVASRFAQTLLKKVPECVDANPVKVAFSIAKVIIDIKDEVGSNKDELAQCLKDTANRLLAVERTIVSGVPKAEEAMENLKAILGKEMMELKDLADKSLATRILDHEAYGSTIQKIFHRVKEATTSFLFEMATSIQKTASEMRDDIKKAALERLRPSEKADHKTVIEDQGLKREVCTDGTRLKILEDITKWTNDCSLASPRVFWLTGQAGSGKTTIAYTIAKRFESLEEDGNANQHTVLGGNFLCSRQFQETQSLTRIIPTIAYQLALKCKSYANALHVTDKFNTVNHDIFSQMKSLLVVPWQLSEVSRNPTLPPYLIVIDALDEIKGDGGSAFLSHLLKAIKEYDLRGFKFLVTSRSDPKVVELCKSFASESVCRLQDVPIEEAMSDIEIYLKTQLPELAGSPEFAELVRRANGLFIYAATVVKYLTPIDSITVGEQTEMLHDFLSKSYEPASSSDDATSLVDELYRQIMYDTFSKLSAKVLAHRLRILYTFLCTAERTSASTVAALILDGDDKAARAVVHDLHAVLYTTQDDRVFWYHGSFPDFIFTQTRSNFRIDKKDFLFSCNQPVHHNLLGISCFSIMKSEKSGLRFNMGNIMSSFLFDTDNTSLSEQVNQNISAVLRYSSRYWTHHLPSPKLINIDNLCCCISEFLQIRVLFWIEAMNLLGFRNQCALMLQSAYQWVLKCGNNYSELAHNIGEAASFATYFTGSPAAESTPHLYISALATWSRDTSLCRNWKNKFARIPVFTYSRGSIDLPLITILSEERVMDVAFSSDGRRIAASVSGSHSVKVWDASTGVELNELKGHTGLVVSVAFSSDGTRIVSSSIDMSVRVWNASTGTELKELKGNNSVFDSVAFLNDGTQIVSGSHDSVQVWDVLTGVEVKKIKRHNRGKAFGFSNNGTHIAYGSVDSKVYDVHVLDVSTGVEPKELKGHTKFVTSIAFSTDDKWIVSGSYDNSVRVWDVSTGMQLKELKGHIGSVNSVAFSRDGTWIVSGSHDTSVRVWDVSTGVELKELKGHTGAVNSVAFSNDGTRIVSGSDDNSLRVWDASTVVELKEMGHTGHTGFITSVAFSADGTWIVSGLDDNSVQVWDASTGVELKKLEGHTHLVKSVPFLSDDKWIVSGSFDNSVHLWDGVELKELKGHTNVVTSVAFSSDGTRVVSGSYDRSVRVWDVSAGVELKVLKGHTGYITSVSFSSDGTHVLSSSSDNSIRVWDVSMIGCEDFDWNLADNNWIISSQGETHLMWVPQAANLVQGFNILIISRSGFSTVDFQQSMIGVDWVHCYTP